MASALLRLIHKCVYIKTTLVRVWSAFEAGFGVTMRRCRCIGGGGGGGYYCEPSEPTLVFKRPAVQIQSTLFRFVSSSLCSCVYPD